ncbi:hypothetical protein SAMN05444487_101176 [Marininema mesophilum]|uniref:Uncharacterized protein n=1 Tax=Marininema mesophilum TaxID=1048340 RepID=A0A1H2QC78_9BACL|nr:hypothetical protein [Marininema mesophilum]SDW04732.1 hypothetical protein SAMN05444487_101176 [Marininema mesophilum]
MKDEEGFYTHANHRVLIVNGWTGVLLLFVDRLILPYSSPLLNHIGMIMIGISAISLLAFLIHSEGQQRQ